jgi:putative Holliday junction resolvase
VGERRIGVAFADGGVPIAVPLTTLIVDGTEAIELEKILIEKHISHVVIGRPRNQSGDTTAQTEAVKVIADKLLQGFTGHVSYQDESLTSVTAENQLKARGRAYEKGDIDRLAAALILQDFLDERV